MVTDPITNASISLAPNARDLPLTKKKRVRYSKLKQSKLDVRREQWLSRGAVKDKKWNEEDNRLDSVVVKTGEGVNLSSKEINLREIGEENGRSVHGHSDFSESPSNSPPSLGSSILGGNDSVPHFTGSSSSSSCHSSSSGCRSGSVTEEEEEEEEERNDDCLDDWEAFADALAATDKQHDQCSESSPRDNVVSQLDSGGDSRNELGEGNGDSSNEQGIVQRAFMNCHAWRPDDAFRPQSLPTLSKQLSFPNTDRRFGCGGISWACGAVMPVPTSCPICFEDLDLTDSSFLPCFCGFRLCLFCHKRILEEDGRCPGCRKPYDRDPADSKTNVHDGSPKFPMARSRSMISRS